MRALDRARRDGDLKYIKTFEVYERLKSGAISKDEAISELGSSFVNAVEIWCRELCIDES